MSSYLDYPSRQAASLEDVAHRPWPLPEGQWLVGQTWESLLFAHWRVEPEALRPLVPASLELDLFDGSAWLGVVSFRNEGTRLRGTLPLPRFSSFLELNVRTYVVRDGRPGVWFFTLDASSRLAVEVGRRSYRLPYHHARMESAYGRFESSRSGEPGVAFSARWTPEGPWFEAEAGSLEAFLVERYSLYADEGQARAEIHHAPWTLRRAHGAVELATVAPRRLEGEPQLLYAERQDVLIWPLEPLAK
ncbi:MAG: YqjF family protein [Gaiellaceae bacterium]